MKKQQQQKTSFFIYRNQQNPEKHRTPQKIRLGTLEAENRKDREENSKTVFTQKTEKPKKQ